MTLVPASFPVPTSLVADRVQLKPLTIHDVVRDYDAVMTSQQELWQRFGDLWGWPTADLSLEQDLIDLAWHQKEAQRRQSFAYAVLDREGERQVGCVYIEAPIHSGYDASVLYWVRSSEIPSGLDDHLGQTVRRWIAQSWPFHRVEYPGRVA